MSGLAFVAAVCSLPLLGYAWIAPRTLSWMPLSARLAAWAASGAVCLCLEMFALAATKGLVSLVSVLGSLYPLTTVSLAAVVLGERPHHVARW
jgi:drug/metabolite transporter (DMT)-like permease